jgi:hypothetical protein
MHGQAPDAYDQKLFDAFRSVSASCDVMVLEGSNNWAEGALVDLTPDRVMDLVRAPGLLISRYETLQTVDTILTVKRYMGDSMVGVLINQVEPPQLDYVNSHVVPFLERRGINVFGVLPRDRLLASVPVTDLIEHMGGQFIGQREWCDSMVESLVIGSMNPQSALSYLRRRPNKAVVTGGDRVDFQLVTLETNTNLLILTGGVQPSLRVVDQAEERRVPILVVPDDTLSAVEKAEQLFGRVRFNQPIKLQQFIDLMDKHFAYDRLYDAIGLKRR